MFRFIKTQGKGIVVGAVLTLITTIISVPVLASSYTRTITVAFNSISLFINGQQAYSENIIFEGRTYVQLKDVAIMLNKDVFWDKATKTASVNDKNLAYTPPVNTNPVQTPVKPTTTVKNGYYEHKYTDAIYKGNFVNDKPNGYGICYYNNGDVYDGNWVNSVKESTSATFTYANGIKYVGPFVNGKATGNGTVYFSNGVYTGEIVDGVLQGYGVYEFESGNTYEGYFSNSKRNGQGTMYYSDGSYEFGTWQNDILVSKG